MKTMTADFSQTGQNGQTLTGKLTLARPGKIRFQYQPGVPLLVVSDGRTLTMVDYQVAHVSRWPVRNTPLGVLLDPDRDPGRYAKVLPSADPNRLNVAARRSEERRVGKECGNTCRSRWSPDHYKKKKTTRKYQYE